MLRHVRLRAISIEFRTENFEKNFRARPQNFAFGIVRIALDRIEIESNRFERRAARRIVASPDARHRRVAPRRVASFAPVARSSRLRLASSRRALRHAPLATAA